MKIKLTCLMLASVLSIVSSSRALAWRESGGGDPLAAEFIRVARQIVPALPEHPAQGEIGRAAFQREIDKVSESLRGTHPLVVFPAGETFNCMNAPKIGCVPTDGRIHIARDGWSESSLRDKIEVTAMEMALLLGQGKNRYEFAPDLATQVLATGFTLNSSITPEYSLANGANGAAPDASSDSKAGDLPQRQSTLNENPQSLFAGNPEQTPFLKLKALFDSAAPMPMSRLPKYTDPSLAHFYCLDVYEETTAADLGANLEGMKTAKYSWTVPVLLLARFVLAPENPGSPSGGPLFPGKSGTPARYQTLTFGGFIFSSVGELFRGPYVEAAEIEDENADLYVSSKIHILSETPGYKFTATGSEDNVTHTYEFRTSGRIIIYKTSIPKAVGYSYCWYE